MLRFGRLGGTTLYLGEPSDASPAGHLGEVLLVLPSQTPTPASTLSLDQAWDFQHPSLGAGYFLFFSSTSDIANLGADQTNELAARIHNLLPRVTRNQHASLGWVTGNPASPSALQLQTLSMVRVGGRAQTVNIPQVLRFHQYEVMVLPATPFERSADGFVLRNTEYMAPPGADPRTDQPTKRRIYLRGAAAYDLDKVGETVEIPLLGGERGGLLFDLDGLAGLDIDAGIMDVALYYVVPEPELGRDQSLRYPLLNLASPTGAAQQATSFNLKARLFPANPMHSIFDFGNGNSSDGPVLQTYFGTYHGHPIHVIPMAGAGLQFTHVPNPGVYPSRAAEVRTHFSLTPVGPFELLVDNPDLIEGSNWLRGGSSGSEFVSFQPKANGQRGDVLVFFRGQQGYAPDFDGDGSSVQQADLGLLTDKFTTSWVHVGHHPDAPQSDRRNQYYAQPDDNVLHTMETDEFLQAVEVAAADLPPLTGTPGDAFNSFPLTPLNGVVAPDDRISPVVGMDKYVIFEKEIMSPTRKNRVSINKLSAIATRQGRALQTNHILNTVTPQGMLVEVEGNDMGALTLAFDGVQNLKIDDIRDEFQDSLGTNRFFMVTSQPDTLSTDDATLFTQNKVEVTGWPFRLQVGQAPPGTPADAGGVHRYNNVVLFKFIEDQTFEELIDDQVLWSNPAFYNDDLPDIQEWLQDFIDDARAKAADPNTSDLYSPLVTGVLDNAGWTGVLAFNVTVPMDEMPCEVQGLLGGVRKLAEFKAHHLGFQISRVNSAATEIDQSSIFALIDYEDDAPTTGGPGFEEYEFLVKTLKVRFANTEIADFASQIAIVMKKAFDESIKDPINTSEKVTIDTLELDGSYQTFNGVPTYTFELVAINNPFEFAGTVDHFSLIHQMTVTKVRFATDTCLESPFDPDTARVTSKFTYWGHLNFRSSGVFDFFSFDKLPFSELTLKMGFGFNADRTPQRPVSPDDFEFDPGNLRFELSGSKPREDSLLSNFPLRLQNFHYATQKLDITDLGYWHIPAFVPGWVDAEEPKYALAFTIDMGPLNGQSAKKIVKGAIDIIAAWEPSDVGSGVSFGVRLGSGSDGNKEFGIEGVLTLAVDNFGFMKIPDVPADGEDFVYAFFIRSAFLKIVNTQIPPGGDFSLMLFVPYTASGEVNLQNLGWFVAYNRSGGSGTSSNTGQHVIDIAIEDVTASPATVQVNQNVTISVTVKNNGNPQVAQPQEEVTVTIKAEAVDPSSNRPLPPTPPSRKVTLAIGFDEDVEFTWPAKVAGKYKFTATANVKGDLSPGSNSKDSNTITVQGDETKKEKRTVVKLDYLGLGHRVMLPSGDLELQMLNTVESVIDVMRNEFVPTQTGTQLQDQLQKIYSKDAGVLIGLDVTIMEVVRIAFLFAETNNLYGALIGFVDKAPSFLKGFQFQILYKKLSDDLGVYQMQLKLPDKIRQFELGAASITIPVIGVDIYTNGDFKLNFGFPVGGNFANSFSIQMMAGPVPIIGYAGFYFNKLSGATSTLVPVLSSTTTAKWDPVLEFGIGLSLGIGKTIEKGPLRAGFSISIVVILEGALAWYHPPNTTLSTVGQPPDWYRVKGQAGLIVNLYGILDFGIVKLGLEVTASAMFTFVYESYKDIELGVKLSVSIRVTLVIGGFKIFGKTVSLEMSFSFSAELSFTFIIENPDGTIAPWNDELAQPLAHRLARRSLHSMHDLTPIAWVPAKVVDDDTDTLALTFAPQVTVAKENGAQYAHAVAGLTIPAGAAFQKLSSALITWAVELHVTDTSALTTATLEELDARLNIPRSLASFASGNDTPLTYEAIMSFLAMNYDEISIVPLESLDDDDEDPAPAPVTVFPMIPELKLVVDGQLGGHTPVDFSSYNERNEAYQIFIAEYFDRLLVDVEHKSGVFLSNRMLQSNHPDPMRSMAEIVFQDYFAFLVKGGIDRAVDLARASLGVDADGEPVTFTLAALLSGLSSAGEFDTLAKMASRFFYHGLRLPPEMPVGFNPDTATNVGYLALSNGARPLYELTGQQVPIKLTPETPAQGDDEAIPAPDWTLSLEHIGGPDSLVTIPDAGLSMTIESDDEESRDNVAALEVVSPSVGATPAVAQVERFRWTPRRFEFENPTYVEVPEDTRVRSLYPFPEVLRKLLNDRSSGVSLTLHNDGDDGTPVAGLHSWALRVNFNAKRITKSADGSGDLLPNTYVIGGATERTRNLIGKLLEMDTPGVESMRMYYELEGKVNALVGEDLGADADVVLMKTNLSTVSAPQGDISLLAHHPEPDDYSAAMIPSQAKDFLRLIWEASIVNAPGYYLYYSNGGDPGESGIDELAFGGLANQANLTLVVTFSALNAACNTLLINDPSSTDPFVPGDLYAEAADEKTWSPAVAPGAVGFELVRQNPQHPNNAANGAAGAVEPLFNLLSYYIDEAGGFIQSIRGLPVGPTSDNLNEDPVPAEWKYRQGIRVYPYATPASDNLYAGTGSTVTIQFEFLDIFGNVLEGAAPPALSAPVLYSDLLKGVGQWPGVTAGYMFGPDLNASQGVPGELSVALSFAAEMYTNDPVDAQRVETALESYLLVREQLNGPGVSAVLTTSVAPGRTVDVKGALTAYVDAIIAYLRNPVVAPDSLTPTTPIRMSSITSNDRNAQASNAFPVTVELTIEREASRVEEQARDSNHPDFVPGVRRAVTSVAPEPETDFFDLPEPTENDPFPVPGDTGQKGAIEAFAIAFEATFPELKVATGLGADGPHTIWAVRLVDSVPVGGRGFAVNISNNPAFFAPAPLSNKLEERTNVPMRLNGVANDPVPQSVTGVDMDVWGREFVEAVDRFLSADLAVTARQVNSGAYLEIIQSKEALATGISTGVINVLEPTSSGAAQFVADARPSARELYRQALLTKLSTAYEIETAVVYPVSTTNTSHDGSSSALPPRLYGNVTGERAAGADDAGFSFSTAKIDLDDESGPKFSFLFDAERTADQASAQVRIRYTVTHLEHDINLPVGGYEASSWLTFVLPERANPDNPWDPTDPWNIGYVDIPIALREYPTPPALIGQNAEPVDLIGATTLEEATLWKYLYTFQQQVVAQDSIFANIRFNVGPEVLARRLADDDLDLLDWLARFHHEYPLLKPHLDLLIKGPELTDQTERDNASAAVGWFADLVKGVAATWGAWVELQGLSRRLQQAALDPYEWDFEFIERRELDQIRIQMLRPEGTNQSSVFPDVEVILDDGDTRSILEPAVAGGVATYLFPWEVPELPETRQRTFILSGLDVLHTENAWGGIHLARNLNLSAPNTSRTTNPRFVYETPQVRFVNKVTPLIDNKQPIELARGSIRSLAGHIGHVLQEELFKTAVQQPDPHHRLVKIGVRYAYDVRGQSGPAIGPGQMEEFQAYLPVTQVMPLELQPNDMNDFINGLAGALNTWLTDTNPSRSRAFYEFDISVFAALSATDLPVLRVRRLWLGLDMIS